MVAAPNRRGRREAMARRDTEVAGSMVSIAGDAGRATRRAQDRLVVLLGSVYSLVTTTEGSFDERGLGGGSAGPMPILLDPPWDLVSLSSSSMMAELRARCSAEEVLAAH